MAKAARWNVTAGWHERTQSPGFITAVPKSGEGKIIPFGQPTGFYLGSPFLWFYELTGDTLYLDKIKAMSGKRGMDQTTMRNLDNWSYVLWRQQGGRIPGR